MPTSEQYRKSAEQRRRAAQRSDDRLEREALMRIAEQWDRLADHKARKEAEEPNGSFAHAQRRRPASSESRSLPTTSRHSGGRVSQKSRPP
jgi:hypothetical protein